MFKPFGRRTPSMDPPLLASSPSDISVTAHQAANAEPLSRVEFDSFEKDLVSVGCVRVAFSANPRRAPLNIEFDISSFEAQDVRGSRRLIRARKGQSGEYDYIWAFSTGKMFKFRSNWFYCDIHGYDIQGQVYLDWNNIDIVACFLVSDRDYKIDQAFNINIINIIDSFSPYITLYQEELLLRRSQLLRTDRYGVNVSNNWFNHLNYFIDNVVMRDLSRTGKMVERTALEPSLRQNLVGFFDRYLAQKALIISADQSNFATDMTGVDYETLCKEGLEKIGWSVSTTPITGDQGADLIAERRGKRLIVQCKRYSSPVGNKAVQEVFAAKHFYKGTDAALISNSVFTQAAQQLANTCSVALIHHDEIERL